MSEECGIYKNPKEELYYILGNKRLDLYYLIQKLFTRVIFERANIPYRLVDEGFDYTETPSYCGQRPGRLILSAEEKSRFLKVVDGFEDQTPIPKERLQRLWDLGSFDFSLDEVSDIATALGLKWEIAVCDLETGKKVFPTGEVEGKD